MSPTGPDVVAHGIDSRPTLLAVADVDLRIDSEFTLLDYPGSPYPPFLARPSEQGAGSSTIDVSVLLGPSPRNDSAPLFDSESAWIMQPEGGGYRLSFRIGDNGPTHTVACSDEHTTRVRVHMEQGMALSDLAPGQYLNPVRYPLDQLLLMNHLALRGGVILHAAGAVVGGGALVFPGVSGAGKSTISRVFVEAGLGDSLLSDDRVIIRTVSDGLGEPEGLTVWGTPWPGDARVAMNARAPLAALLFLVKAEVNELVPLTSSAALRRLLPMVTCPWYDARRFPGALDTCGWIVQGVPCYDLRFRPDAELIPLLTERSWARAGGLQ
jgi:hypothetical protein